MKKIYNETMEDVEGMLEKNMNNTLQEVDVALQEALERLSLEAPPSPIVTPKTRRKRGGEKNAKKMARKMTQKRRTRK